jgi:hypothetical protein
MSKLSMRRHSWVFRTALVAIGFAGTVDSLVAMTGACDHGGELETHAEVRWPFEVVRTLCVLTTSAGTEALAARTVVALTLAALTVAALPPERSMTSSTSSSSHRSPLALSLRLRFSAAGFLPRLAGGRARPFWPLARGRRLDAGSEAVSSLSLLCDSATSTASRLDRPRGLGGV